MFTDDGIGDAVIVVERPAANCWLSIGNGPYILIICFADVCVSNWSSRHHSAKIAAIHVFLIFIILIVSGGDVERENWPEPVKRTKVPHFDTLVLDLLELRFQLLYRTGFRQLGFAVHPLIYASSSFSVDMTPSLWLRS